MRVLKLGVYHPTYLREFYAKRPALAAQPSAAQHAALIEDCYGSADFWTNALAQLGYETCDTIANAAPLQKRWADERGANYDDSRWLFDITEAQIKAFRPDILIAADYSTFDADFYRRIKRECPSLRRIIGWCGAPYNDPAVFRAWDITLSCIPELVGHFRAEGLRSYHLNHAFEPRLLDRIDTARPPTVDFSFLGSIMKQDRFHLARERILLTLVEETDLQLWSEIKHATRRQRRGVNVRRFAYDAVETARTTFGLPQSLLAATPLVGKVARWGRRPSHAPSIDERIARRARPPLFGLAMFQQLRDSRVALNTHIDISPQSASNMRLFEATGVGACLLTDAKENLAEMFEPDAEVLTYSSPEECVEKVKYALAHEDERRAIARAGQRRTLRDHTFKQRAARIDEIIREAFS